MKIRKGFVSNSSSSSFVITDKVLTEGRIKSLITSNFDVSVNDIDYAMTFDKVSQEDIEYRRDCGDYSKLDKHLGSLVINSKEDNSIPWEIQEYIEDELDGIHYHWG